MSEKDLNVNFYGVITDKTNPNYGRTKTLVMSRSMGYIRPVSNFNIGKYAEYMERKMFREDKCLAKAA